MKSEDAFEYVTKEDTRIDGPYEYGTRPKIGVTYNTKQILEADIKDLVENDVIKPL